MLPAVAAAGVRQQQLQALHRVPVVCRGLACTRRGGFAGRRGGRGE
jgi:hypothetical protein